MWCEVLCCVTNYFRHKLLFYNEYHFRDYPSRIFGSSPPRIIIAKKEETFLALIMRF